MEFVNISRRGPVAALTLNRGKVNALNEKLVDEFHDSLSALENDDPIRAVMITGRGKFFSFGFDIPEFQSYPRDDFRRYLKKFTDLYSRIFIYPKPVIAAINGHAIAGGCMLASACDYRTMVTGKARISLNELSFGSSVFAGSVEILKYCVGERHAESILLGAGMYSAEQARAMGLVDKIAGGNELEQVAIEAATEFAAKDPAAFAGIKKLLRKPVVDLYAGREDDSIENFLDIWYSESTRKNLEQIKIRD